MRMRDGKVQWKGLRVNVDKTKGMKVLFGKKSSVFKVDPCGSVVCGLVVILFNVRNVRDGFIVIVLMTFFQNWEIRVVFTKSPYHEWGHVFFVTTRKTLDSTILEKKYFRA